MAAADFMLLKAVGVSPVTLLVREQSGKRQRYNSTLRSALSR